MKLIVGLGNPGDEYVGTRHNVGFSIIDKYLGEVPWKKDSKSHSFIKKIGRENIIFLKPQTFMNLSGTVVSEFMKYYKLDVSNLLVIQDDLDIPTGEYKVKNVSSSGGHNGIKSIIEFIGSNSFSRIKIGISKSKNKETKNYVLGNFTEEEMDKISQITPEIIDLINKFIKQGLR